MMVLKWHNSLMGLPRKIICLTEESVETLYLLNRPDLIQGISKFAERPQGVKERHPIVTEFIRSDVERIIEMRPDLVIGFSDLQKDIARDLIGGGLNVLVTNQRSLAEILEQIELLGRIIGEGDRAVRLTDEYRRKMRDLCDRPRKKQPRVYFEEWDRPRISSIQWVSELIEVCGGENIFAQRSMPMARDREVSDLDIVKADPEIILGCWCGKKVDIKSFSARPGYQDISAIKNGHVYEVSPAIFLQPGPALFTDGLDQLFSLIQRP